MASQTASDRLLETLLAWGVDTIFGIPGDGINGIIEADIACKRRFQSEGGPTIESRAARISPSPSAAAPRRCHRSAAASRGSLPPRAKANHAMPPPLHGIRRARALAA